MFWRLPGIGISNMNFMIADVIEFVSGTMITFSKGVQQKSNQSSFQSLAPGLQLMLRADKQTQFQGKHCLKN